MSLIQGVLFILARHFKFQCLEMVPCGMILPDTTVHCFDQMAWYIARVVLAYCVTTAGARLSPGRSRPCDRTLLKSVDPYLSLLVIIIVYNSLMTSPSSLIQYPRFRFCPEHVWNIWWTTWLSHPWRLDAFPVLPRLSPSTQAGPN